MYSRLSAMLIHPGILNFFSAVMFEFCVSLLSSRCTFFPFAQRYSRRVVLPSGRERARTCRTGHVGRRNSLVVLDVSRDKARAFVCGDGDVGKACVFAFRGSGAHVFVPECELLCVLEASFKGVQASCLKSTSLFSQRITSTSAFLHLMKKMKNNVFVGNTAHLDNEIDFAGSEVMEGVKVGSIKPLNLFASSPLAPVSCRQEGRLPLARELDKKMAT